MPRSTHVFTLVAAVLVVVAGANRAWSDVSATCDGRTATLVGTAGDDTLVGTSGPDVIVGLAGQDLIRGLGGDDLLCGDEDGDDVQGGEGDDRLLAGEGDPFAVFDVLLGGPGADQMIGSSAGGTGISYAGTASGVGVDLSTGESTGGAGHDTFDLIDSVLGSAHDDTIIGSWKAEFLDAGRGDDKIIGGIGSDRIRGGCGDDVLRGGFGDDLMYGDEVGCVGADRMFGEAEDDRFLAPNKGDRVDGGGDFDWASYGEVAGPVKVNLTKRTGGGFPGKHRLLSIEQVAGTQFADVLIGDDGYDRFVGLAGDDVLRGRGGVNEIEAGDGDDRVIGGSGLDGVLGGPGDDVMEGGAGNDSLDGQEGVDTADGGPHDSFDSCDAETMIRCNP